MLVLVHRTHKHHYDQITMYGSFKQDINVKFFLIMNLQGCWQYSTIFPSTLSCNQTDKQWIMFIMFMVCLHWNYFKLRKSKRRMVSDLHTELLVIPRRDIHKFPGCLQSKYHYSKPILITWKNNYWLELSSSRCNI